MQFSRDRGLSHCLGWAFSLLLSVCMFEHAFAFQRAEKYEQGEEVEVLFLDEWHPGRVLDMNRKGEVMVEYEFAAASQQRIFPPAQIRHMYESGAIARGKIWTDSTGEHKIKAALLKLSGNKVFLRTEEMKEVQLTLDKLSDADKRFVEKFKGEAGLNAVPVASRPEPTRFTTSRSGSSGRSMAPSVRPPGQGVPDADLKLEADPLRSSLQLIQAGISFPKVDFHDSMGTLLPLGGKDNWMLASIENNFGANGLPVRLLWGSLAKQTIQKIQLIPPGEVVLDYYPKTQLLLTQAADSTNSMGTILTLWKVGPAADEAEGVVSWQATLDDDSGYRGAAVWARFASENIIIQRDSSHRIIAWDLAGKRVAWSTPQQSFFAPVPTISPGGAYLYLPEDSGLRILDPTTGDELGTVPTANSCSSVAPHPNGRHLAVLANNDMLIVDITGADKQRKLQASGIGTPFSRKMEWVNDDLIAVELNFQTSVVYSLPLELPVWSYTFDADAYSANARSGLTRSVIDGHLAYAAGVGMGTNAGLVIGAVELPEAAVKDRIAKISRKDFVIFGPGGAVRIDASGTAEPARVQAALSRKAVESGWVVNASAANVLKAAMKRGETQTVQYESGLGTGASIQSATVTPYVSTLTLTVGGKDAWTSGTSTGVPPVVMLSEGQSLQSEVDRWQQPDIEFFERVELPKDVIDPAKTEGIGSSSVTNRGLIAKP